MTSYNVELILAAYDDLDHIFDYILLDSHHAAGEVLTRIFTSLRYLEKFPFADTMLIESTLRHYELRMIISDPYIAFYRVIENTVFVYRILHGARDFIQILKSGQ